MTIYSFLPFGVPLHPGRSSSPAASFTNPPHPLLFLRTDFVSPCGKIGGADRRIIRHLIAFLIGADYAFCALSAPADFPQEIPQAGYTLHSQRLPKFSGSGALSAPCPPLPKFRGSDVVSVPAEIPLVACALRTLSALPKFRWPGVVSAPAEILRGACALRTLSAPPEIPRVGCCFSVCRNSAVRALRARPAGCRRVGPVPRRPGFRCRSNRPCAGSCTATPRR